LAIVRDEWGNPVGGDTVTFSASAGYFGADSSIVEIDVVTSALGYASATYHAPTIPLTGDDINNVVITATMASSSATIYSSNFTVLAPGSFRRMGMEDYKPKYDEEIEAILIDLGLLPSRDER
jgi:hypothetical protein